MTPAPWHQAPLLAFDLEGTGAQDRDQEAILELAAVPILAAQPQPESAYTTLVNPGRRIPRRPWISPGITDQTLADAPTITQVGPLLAPMIDGRWIVGHNVGVDWRLLHRHLPDLRPAGLIDTLPLARRLTTDGSRSLTAMTGRLGLDATINAMTPGSRPHRALWDATAAAALLGALVAQLWPDTPPTLSALGGVTTGTPPAAHKQATLFD